MAEITIGVDVAASPQATWRAATDWIRQGDWIPATRVRVVRGAGDAVGDRFVARTAVGPFGFDDPMEIVHWDPPHRCEVRHLGRVVRGSGAFEVAPAGTGRSRLVWTERLDLPLGRVGRLGFPLVRPIAAAGLRHALRRFAVLVESRAEF